LFETGLPDGLAQFCVAGGVTYDVRVNLTDFRKKRVQAEAVPKPGSSGGPIRITVPLQLDSRVWETVE
jgi:hypothetical protein